MIRLQEDTAEGREAHENFDLMLQDIQIAPGAVVGTFNTGQKMIFEARESLLSQGFYMHDTHQDGEVFDVKKVQLGMDILLKAARKIKEVTEAILAK